jgi:transcriptional regulator with XRE-family HTH domain
MFIFAGMKIDKIMDEIGNAISPDINAKTEMSVAIVNRINDILKSEKMTQKDLARLMGKTETEVSRWLSGTHNLTVATLCKISAVLGKEVLHVADYELDDVQSIEGRDIVYEKQLFNKYHKDFVDTYKERIIRFEEDNRFRRDDRYHNKISGHHIVYKLIVNPSALEKEDQTRILNKEKTRGYEFLIEFDVNKPSYGIYYGCRGLIFGNQTQEIQNFQNEWEKTIRKKVVEVLNNTFPRKSFDELCLLTDNANNRTYWPFWIRLSEDEDIIKVAGLAVRLIYNVYKMYLEEPGSFDEKHTNKSSVEQKKRILPPLTQYTVEAFDALFQEKMSKTKKIIEIILERAEAEDVRLILPNKLYEKAWNYNKDFFNSDAEFAFFLLQIYSEIVCKYNNDETKKYIIQNRGIQNKRSDQDINVNKAIIWPLFIPYLLSYNGRPLSNIRKAYSKNDLAEDTIKKINGYVEKIAKHFPPMS